MAKIKKVKPLSVDIFDSKYTAYTKNKSKEGATEPGVFETFGADIDTVIEYNKKHPKRVWTMLEGDDGSLWMVQGLHFVNRLKYHLVNEDCSDIEYSSDFEGYFICK